MNRNVTASFSLSVSLVVLFTVVLYQPDGPVPSSLQASPVGPADVHQPNFDENRGRPQLTPSTPLVESSGGNAMSIERSPYPTVEGETEVPVVVAKPSQRASGGQVEETKPALAPVLSPSAFTYARPGETLADIAARVYGSPESARKVWMANRDLFDSVDAIPDGGTPLRTP